MRQLASEGIPVAVTCRASKLAHQSYFRWLTNPVTTADLVEAYRAKALFNAHQGDPEYGHRFLTDEARDAGQPMARHTAWRICSANGWFSVFSAKHQGKNTRPGPPVHDDHVGRDFTADAPNELWLADITQHRTMEGKPYVCAIQDVFSSRIVGYSIDSRMKSNIAVNAVAKRRDVTGCIVHTEREI